MAITHKQVFQEVKGGKIRPFYIILGEEDYFLDEFLWRLKKRLFKDTSSYQMNFQKFSGDDLDIPKLINSLKTPPFFEANRLTVVSEAECIPARDMKTLSIYLKNPSTNNCLVMVFKVFDRRLAFFKEPAVRKALVEFLRPKERELPSWVRRLVSAHHKSIGRDAVETIAQRVGNDLKRMKNEIEKLSLMIGEEPRITKDHVRKVITDYQIEGIFDLADAIGGRNTKKALMLLRIIIESGESPIGLIGLMSRHFRILLSVREGLERGKGRGELGDTLGLRDFIVRRYLAQARRFQLNELVGAFEVIHRTDLALKGGRLNQERYLEKMIFDICP